jgi:peptidyl-prolyl cis-trans isomerase SurA
MKKLFIFLICGASSIVAFSQGKKTIDGIAAVVGNNIILYSEIDIQYFQMLSRVSVGEKAKCELLEQMMVNKLLIHQAKLDSVVITDNQVESELDRRLKYFIQQIGSEEKLEEYYKKSIFEIKADFKELIKEQLLSQNMQSKITKDITATPSDVKAYFDHIEVDSLPLINAEIEIAQIVRSPPVSEQQKQDVKRKLEVYRKRIINGEEFSTLSILYSQDPSTSKKGGEVGYVGRGDLVPEFEAAAFRLKENEVSEIVETKFGYHLIQLIDRRGEQINVRHILLKPEILAEDMAKTKQFLDRIKTRIEGGKISFDEAALKFSDNEETKNNGGLVINPQTGTSKFEPDQLDPGTFFQIDKLKVGEVSSAVMLPTPEGKEVYKLILLKSRTSPHKANLKDDYQKIQAATLSGKQSKAMEDWVKEERKKTFVEIGEQFRSCENMAGWLKKETN